MNKFNTSLIAVAAAAAIALPLLSVGGGMGGMGGGTGGARVNSSGGNSPHETTGAVIGDRRTGNRVTISYGRPLSKDRKIWGGLVPWNQAWRLGSDEATTIISQQPIAFGDVVLQGGVAYTLYMVPSESGTSKLAISKKIGQWGIPVDETQDLGRVDLKKEATPAPVDQLTIAVANDTAAGGGVIKISWETTMFSVPFTVKK